MHCIVRRSDLSDLLATISKYLQMIYRVFDQREKVLDTLVQRTPMQRISVKNPLDDYCEGFSMELTKSV